MGLQPRVHKQEAMKGLDMRGGGLHTADPNRECVCVPYAALTLYLKLSTGTMSTMTA